MMIKSVNTFFTTSAMLAEFAHLEKGQGESYYKSTSCNQKQASSRNSQNMCQPVVSEMWQLLATSMNATI